MIKKLENKNYPVDDAIKRYLLRTLIFDKINECIDAINNIDESSKPNPKPVMCNLGPLSCGQRCDFRQINQTLCENDSDCPFKVEL